jgi:hypothetical protein
MKFVQAVRICGMLETSVWVFQHDGWGIIEMKRLQIEPSVEFGILRSQ